MNNPSPEQAAYVSGILRHKRIITRVRIFLFVSFLLLWESAAYYNLIDSFIFSSPSRILRTLIAMILDKSIFIHIGITLLETVISFLLVILLGIGCAVLLWRYNSLSEILEPYLVALNSLPKSALAPLLIVWLGSSMRTIIVAGISVALFGSILNLYTGFKETDPDRLKLIYTLNGSKTDALTKVILPSNIPLIISISKVNIGLSLVGVIIGEFIGARRGLGYLIIYSSQVFQLNTLLLSILLLCLIALALYKLIDFLEKTCLKHI